ncbi:tetratricopeptide repeat protein [Histidinibacterium aquaticum]|uniref:Tetratricopeptide repeat protein n=1 Tax=Histidinibacterium aquaticum TaxID=2613962 RepID=A0A5J5GRN5_9RHOB|nr:tetratricopeptide repeat protein [Histidinibacterium aquaticum]KAA9010238.1 tetratricopeptide repeat protein [Histidinibacterium aquaticum]
MASIRTLIKCIVASGLLSAGLSLSAGAETLDEMYQDLAAAETEEEARRIEERIASEWAKSGSAAIDLLWQRGRDALEAGDPRTAAEHFTAAIDHAPDFAEAYHGRATAYFMQDLYGPALDDIRQTLVLNPRHFGAMRGLAIILEQIGDEETAMQVSREILEIHPYMADVAEALERLELRQDGIPL